MPLVEHFYADSPVGDLLLLKTDGMLSGLYLPNYRHGPKDVPGTRVYSGFEEEVRQLHEYFAGQRTDFDLPLYLEGTPFQRSVWQMLETIPYGQTWSYKQLAEALHNPAGTRAVGAANGRNPISIIVPCHRVIGANGCLTGYGGGLSNKEFLLALESPIRILPLHP
jgi:methylated-DNA-[protein]-cysteine S-methyltransferase